MFRKEKMMGSNNLREKDNFYDHYYQHNNNLYDVGSSSQNSSIKNNYYINNVGPSYRGSKMDEIDLLSGFQKLGIDNRMTMANDHGLGRFGLDLDRVSTGLRIAPPLSLCRDDGEYGLLGGRVSAFGDSVGSFSGFSGGVRALGESAQHLGGFYDNVGLDLRGNSLYGERVSRIQGQRRDGCYNDELPNHFQSMYDPRVVDDALQQYMMMDGCKELLNPLGSSRNYGGINSLGSPSLFQSNQGLSRRDLLFHSMRESMRVSEAQRDGSPPLALLKKMTQPYIGDGGRSNHTNGRRKSVFGERGFDLNGSLQHERSGGGIDSPVGSCDSLVLDTIYSSLAEVQGNIYHMAKDQNGCRFLQKKFEDGSFENVQIVFNEIIDHVVELMINPFGNYLIQKLLDVCDEEQRMKIVYMVTKDQDELVRICLNTHGTRVVQKLIDSLKTRKQISLILRALEPCFLDLIQDLNGNHVIQRCLQCLHCDDIKFIFEASAKFCVKIATHRHGCCVLQRCIAHSNGDHRTMLIEEICHNGLMLAQDPFGNYVVQYIIELRIPSAAAHLISQFEGHFVQLSMQKFSSHVVEKCLKFIEESQARIVCELLSVPHFEQLLQDPFANYVVQSALEVTKGAVKDSLAAAVRPHSTLRTNPHCKKIFTRGLIKN